MKSSYPPGQTATSFKRDLARLGRELAEEASEAIDRASHLLADEIRAQSPVLTGTLKASVEVREIKSHDGRISQFVEVEGGYPEGRWYVGFVEYGARGVPANPFIRRSIAAKEASMIRVIEASLKGS
jgi:HK97 gp10 family phage protein